MGVSYYRFLNDWARIIIISPFTPRENVSLQNMNLEPDRNGHGEDTNSQVEWGMINYSRDNIFVAPKPDNIVFQNDSDSNDYNKSSSLAFPSNLQVL